MHNLLWLIEFTPVCARKRLSEFKVRCAARARNVLTRGKNPQKVRKKSRTKAEKRAAREIELASKVVALPSKRYAVIVADPERLRATLSRPSLLAFRRETKATA